MCRNSINYCRTVGIGAGAFVGKTALENQPFCFSFIHRVNEGGGPSPV